MVGGGRQGLECPSFASLRHCPGKRNRPFTPFSDRPLVVYFQHHPSQLPQILWPPCWVCFIPRHVGGQQNAPQGTWRRKRAAPPARLVDWAWLGGRRAGGTSALLGLSFPLYPSLTPPSATPLPPVRILTSTSTTSVLNFPCYPSWN